MSEQDRRVPSEGELNAARDVLAAVPIGPEIKFLKSVPGRFSYVRYDTESAVKQEEFKRKFEEIESFAVANLRPGRPLSLMLTALEEAYMWTGKAIRDEQVERNSMPGHEPHRSVG